MNYWDSFFRQRTVSRRKALALAGGGITSAALLAACGGDDKAPSGGESQSAGTPQKGGRYTVITPSSVANWNPISNNSDATKLSGSHVYDRLLSVRISDRRYVLEAAASMETPDPTTVVFKLTPGMVFQNLPPVNGRALKADDIVQSQQYVTTLTNAFNNSFQRDFLQSAEAPDDNTVIYHLKRPDAYLLSTNHLGGAGGQQIIPKEMLPVLNDHTPVGSGPYELTNDYSFNSRYLYKRFDKFRGAVKGLPYIDEHEVLFLSDNVAIEAALKGGKSHSWEAPATLVDRIISESDGKLILGSTPGIRGLGFHLNMSDASLPWKDIRVRQAFYRFTNRQQELDLVQKGKGKVQPGTVPAGQLAYQLDVKETEQFYKNDLREAKQLLEAANFDFNREWSVLSPDSGIGGTVPGQVWQQQATQIGMKTNVQVLPFAAWLQERVVPGKYEILVTSSPADDTPAVFMRYQHSDQKSQFGRFGLGDAEIDALIEKSESATNFEENVKLVKQIQLMVLQKYSSVMMFFTLDYLEAYDARLQDFEIIALPIAKYQSEAWFKSA